MVSNLSRGDLRVVEVGGVDGDMCSGMVLDLLDRGGDGGVGKVELVGGR